MTLWLRYAIVKTQGGTLVLTGANTHAGGTRIEDGVVAVAADDALGQAGGALTLDGGVLRVTGDSYRATNRTVLVGVDGGGFDIAAAGHVFTLGRGILGGGELYKLGASTLALAGDNAGFAGSATVTDGRLTVGAGGLGGPISVQSGGTLGGSGTLGDAGAAVTIAARGRPRSGRPPGPAGGPGRLCPARHVADRRRAGGRGRVGGAGPRRHCRIDPRSALLARCGRGLERDRPPLHHHRQPGDRRRKRNLRRGEQEPPVP
ncbi:MULTISPECIES: autotransporter-associated beta strand repeat-containing protein [Paracoccus]|uniref:Autotransporter-associated beta strand protein n=1 Tax=Paracoccus versutus TaxID=34007 RepID=A0A3D9XDK8_PARVE|nr:MULTISPECIES: autotransporter-associated beta strand repeat-containing protein [Paracoccus]REF68617.1 autotransporter-associated beta strand protein [Paracoccus versutus]